METLSEIIRGYKEEISQARYCANSYRGNDDEAFGHFCDVANTLERVVTKLEAALKGSESSEYWKQRCEAAEMLCALMTRALIKDGGMNAEEKEVTGMSDEVVNETRALNDAYCNKIERLNFIIARHVEYLRELIMRANFAFPESEKDLEWFNEGINDKGRELLEKLFEITGITEQKDSSG